MSLLRGLLRSPGYTAAVLFSLTLGIGANTAIFTLTSAIFLRPLAVSDPDHLPAIFTVDGATRSSIGNLVRTGISLPNIADIAARNARAGSPLSSSSPGTSNSPAPAPPSAASSIRKLRPKAMPFPKPFSAIASPAIFSANRPLPLADPSISTPSPTA